MSCRQRHQENGIAAAFHATPFTQHGGMRSWRGDTSAHSLPDSLPVGYNSPDTARTAIQFLQISKRHAAYLRSSRNAAFFFLLPCHHACSCPRHVHAEHMPCGYTRHAMRKEMSASDTAIAMKRHEISSSERFAVTAAMSVQPFDHVYLIIHDVQQPCPMCVRRSAQQRVKIAQQGKEVPRRCAVCAQMNQ